MTYRRFLAIGFRLSIVAALASAAWAAWSDWSRYAAERTDTELSNRTMECAARLSANRLARVRNEFGNFDVGKLGCSGRSFITSQMEIDEARAGRKVFENFRQPFVWESVAAIAGLALIAINLLCSLVVGAHAVAMWVVGKRE